MPALDDDAFIRCLAELHHLDTAAPELARRAVTAEMRHLAIRANTAASWSRQHWTTSHEPAAGADYRIDAYVRSLAARHAITAAPGEGDIDVTRRAMLAELGHLKGRALALQGWTDANGIVLVAAEQAGGGDGGRSGTTRAGRHRGRRARRTPQRRNR